MAKVKRRTRSAWRVIGRASIAVLSACAGSRPVRDTALADRMTDCSCAHVVYVQTVKETGDVDRIRDAERLYATIGYYFAAGRALSSEEQGKRRFALTRERYDAVRDSVPTQYTEDVRRRRFLDALGIDMAECLAVRKEHASMLDEAVKRYTLDKDRRP